MFAPETVRSSEEWLRHRSQQRIQRLTVAESRSRANALQSAYDPEKETLARVLSADEQAFVVSEQLLCQIDFRYCCERYLVINKSGVVVEPIAPFWCSQELVLKALATIERKQAEGYQDGCLVTVLKARQLGVSSLAAALCVHQVVTQPNRRALVASDVTDSSAHLFGMAELMYRKLPWFLRPPSTKYVTSGEHRHFFLNNESAYLMESGKAMRGQKVEDTGEGKGELGRGKTWTAIHLSELATWENPEQIDSALFPGVPVLPHVTGLLESTAKGRYNWWHRQWLASVAGNDRFAPVFIPWYAEPAKWRLRPPPDWNPADATLSHARLCEAEGARWLGGPVSLTRDQLYWYERARATAEEKEQLAYFLAEYPATPEECFQFSGRSIFSLAVRERIKRQARKIESVWLIEPAAMAEERAAVVRDGGSPDWT